MKNAKRQDLTPKTKTKMMEGIGVSVWENIKGGILLGTEGFVASMGPALRETEPDFEIRRKERFANRPTLDAIFAEAGSDRRLRDLRIHEAVVEHGYALTTIAKHVGLHPSTLSRIVKQVDEQLNARGKF